MSNFNLHSCFVAVIALAVFSAVTSSSSSMTSRRLTEGHRPEAPRENFNKNIASQTAINEAHRSDVDDVITENFETGMKPNRLLQKLLQRNPEVASSMSTTNGESFAKGADNYDVIKEDEKRPDARRCFYHALNCW